MPKKPRRSRKRDPQDPKELLKRLNRIIDEEIRACLKKGKTDVEIVCEKVEKRASVLLSDLGDKLGKQKLRDRVRTKLKHTAVDPNDAEETVEQDRQIRFKEMEEFRGVDPTITFEDKPGHVAFIQYVDAKRFERRAAERLRKKSLDFDENKYLVLVARNDWCDLLIPQYGDLPAGELWQLWKNDQSAAAVN